MKTWEELYKDPDFSPPKYPEPVVVRWAKTELSPSARVIDIGCGAARHALMLREEGVEAWACDPAETAYFNHALAKGAFTVGRSEADALEYQDEHFDAVLCWGVLYYLPIERYRAAITEIHRVLKPGGKALVMVKSPDDSRADFSLQNDRNGYTVKMAPAGMSWASEVGMTLTLLRRGQIANLFAAFSELHIERQTTTHCNGHYADDDFHIYATK